MNTVIRNAIISSFISVAGLFAAASNKPSLKSGFRRTASTFDLSKLADSSSGSDSDNSYSPRSDELGSSPRSDAKEKDLLSHLERAAINAFLRLPTDKTERSPERLPAYLQPYFHGISLFDLITFDLLPEPEHTEEGKRLNLSGLHLKSLEGLRNIKSIRSVSILNLANNRLTSEAITSSELSLCRRLKVLFLQDNPLTTLSKNMFIGLFKLQFLHLARCALTELPQDTFYFVRNKLKVLELSGNNLTHLYPDIFKKMHACMELYLHDNHFSAFERYTFVPLSCLTYLSVKKGNPIGADKKAFKDMEDELIAVNDSPPEIQ